MAARVLAAPAWVRAARARAEARPAPVQAAYMGYAGTLGAAHYDYIIADNVVAPPQRQPFYAEKIMALPDTYWVTDDRRAEAGENGREVNDSPRARNFL